MDGVQTLNTRKIIDLHLTVACTRNRAEANRAERPVWAERALQRAEPQGPINN
jgi:hypothetical protein